MIKGSGPQAMCMVMSLFGSVTLAVVLLFVLEMRDKQIK